jgi:hypothetical protein
MRSSSPLFAIGVMLANAGLLVALVFGQNLGHPSAGFSWSGLAVMVVGLVLMGVTAANRRRRATSTRVRR